MVVNGLHEYMCRKENSSVIRKKINILDEIDQWRSVKKVRPKVLIDVKDIIHAGVQRDNMGQLLGGRYSLNVLYFRHFFKAMEKAKAELVFFVAGKTLSDDLPLFIPDREEEYISYIQIMDEIDASGGDTGAYVAKKLADIKAPPAMEANLHKIAREYGEMRTNYFRHNQEIAQYVQQYDDSVLAIITNDTDFMVFDGKYKFWRANDIDMNGMTVFDYCRQKLREHIQLDTQQLQLLSALSGSMYLPCDFLTEFYVAIGISSWIEGKHIGKLANYIRERTKYGCTMSVLEQLASDAFGEKYTTQDVNAIENGLIQYNLNFQIRTPKALEFCKDRNMFIYKLLTDDVYLIKDISYIDFRNFKSKNYAELIVPLLRKVQGILDANERPRPKTRAVCIKHAHDEPYKLYNEPIDYPLLKVPEWFSLVFKTNDDNYDAIRWALFDWMFKFGTKFNKSLQNVHTSAFTIVLITLKYLLQQGEITIDEADAILVAENYTRIVYKNRIPLIDFPKKINTHAIRIAHLYTKMYVFIRNCVEICGLFYYTSQDYVMFDGRYFHKILEDITNCPEQKKKDLQSIQKDRIYVN